VRRYASGVYQRHHRSIIVCDEPGEPLFPPISWLQTPVWLPARELLGPAHQVLLVPSARRSHARLRPSRLTPTRRCATWAPTARC
jgi:hypothetical protein